MDDTLGITGMAQKAPALVEDLLRKVQQNLTCSVCQELMFLPFLLQCGHSVCYDCIESWLAKRDTGTCPICRHSVESRPILSVGMKDIVEDLTAVIAASDTTLGGKLLRLKNEQLKHRKDDIRIHGKEFPKFIEANAALLDADDDGERIRRCSRCLWEISGPVCEHCGARVVGYDEFQEEDEEEDDEDLMVGYDQTMETVESMNSEDERFLDDRDLDELSVHSEDSEGEDYSRHSSNARTSNTRSDPILLDSSDAEGPEPTHETIDLDDDEIISEPRRRRAVVASDDDDDTSNSSGSPFEMVTEPTRPSGSGSKSRSRVIEDEEDEVEIQRKRNRYSVPEEELSDDSPTGEDLTRGGVAYNDEEEEEDEEISGNAYMDDEALESGEDEEYEGVEHNDEEGGFEDGYDVEDVDSDAVDSGGDSEDVDDSE